MKKTSNIFIYFLLLVGLLLGWFAYKRHFYYFGDTGKCVTVWKRIGGKCYIIPGKYYGITAPDNYVEIGNLDNVTIYWSNEIPEKYIVRNEGYKFDIISHQKDNKFLKFEDKKKYYRSLLYLQEAKKHNDIKPNVEIMNISIREPYATDKKGNKL
ncbi:hypothetical protein JSO56_05780 [Riemerella anatipestifer]|uniref:hypothetical protein n=1 Tax=Riemerella anatipestifer TaxID=34085 RepID=UPI0030C098AD